ncbi:MAG: ribosomal protein L7/L12 [Mariniblastus sp.]
MEESLIQEILNHPELDSPRLVYADWLEDRGDGRAEFLRQECELFQLCFDHRDAFFIKSRLIELAEELDHEWVDRVATKYDVWIKGNWSQKLLAVKIIRTLTGLNLESALDIANLAPAPVVKGLNLTQAELANRTILKAIGTFFGPSQFEIIPNWRTLKKEH